MKVIILGSGLIGVSSAYFLRKNGHEVTVVDRQKDVALETSYANGGQISVCYSEPWSSFSNVKKIVQWLGKDDSPILLKPQFSMQQFLWGAEFLYHCLPFKYHQNIKDMLKISLYSRGLLQELRNEHNLNYNQKTNGILTFYTSQDTLKHGIEAAHFMSKFGCNRYVKNKEETLSIEPTLINSTLSIYGSDYTPDDESGDAKLYTEELKKICISMGVEFIFEKEIIGINKNLKNNSIESVEVVSTNNIQHSLVNEKTSFIKLEKPLIIKGDIFVCALGSYSSLLAKKIGIYLPIYPAKGYSATIPILNSDIINKVSLTDLDMKIVLTRLGNELRVAGTAEFNGYNLEINNERCIAMLDRVKKIYPQGLDFNNTKFWTGLRPSTPGNVPIIKKIKYDNFYVNSGHGTLGWTMATGSGKLLSQIVDNQKKFS